MEIDVKREIHKNENIFNEYYSGNVVIFCIVLFCPIPVSSKTNSIFIDKNNTKWISTDQGLVMFNSLSDVTLFNYDSTGLYITDVRGVAEDSFGNVWIATNSGLYKYTGKHYIQLF